jgi:hypothetical protein
MGLLTGHGLLRLPALPNTAWFFFASPPNYLSLRDDLPAQGSLAATFHSPPWSGVLLPFGVLALPLLALPAAVRGLRRLARPLVRQSAVQLNLDPTDWHTYHLEWQAAQACFSLDGKTILETQVTPHGRLGLVIWIDNQYLTLRPDGRLRYGMLASPEPAWIEVGDLTLTRA